MVYFTFLQFSALIINKPEFSTWWGGFLRSGQSWTNCTVDTPLGVQGLLGTENGLEHWELLWR